MKKILKSYTFYEFSKSNNNKMLLKQVKILTLKYLNRRETKLD